MLASIFATHYGSRPQLCNTIIESCDVSQRARPRDKGSFRIRKINFSPRALLLRERIECNRAYKKGGAGLQIEERLREGYKRWRAGQMKSLGVLKDCITGKMACLIRPFIRRATAGSVREKRGSFCASREGGTVPSSRRAEPA